MWNTFILQILAKNVEIYEIKISRNRNPNPQKFNARQRDKAKIVSSAMRI